MAERLVIAGLGGQGVVLVTRLLTRAAVALGQPVIASETHGMSQRGGAVVSHLKIGGSEGPLIQRGTADALLALSTEEALRNLPFLRRGGLAFVNSESGLLPEVTEHLDRLDIAVHTLPTSRLAAELGAPAVANVALVGFAVAHPALGLDFDAVREALSEVVPRSLELNVAALETGHRAGLSRYGVETPVDNARRADGSV